MAKAPYFKFYPKDFKADSVVEMMTTEGVGAYVLLLCAAWHEDPPGSLPNCDRTLARLARLPSDQWSEVKPDVLAAFTLGDDGRWHQARMRREFESYRATAKKRKKAAEDRWGRQKESNSNANAFQKECHAGYDSDSGSDSGSDSSPGGGSAEGGGDKADADRAEAFAALGRALGREPSFSDDSKLEAMAAVLPESITVHGKPVDRWTLLTRCVSAAAQYGDCHTAANVCTYARQVFERCKQHECWPGEWPKHGKVSNDPTPKKKKGSWD